VTEPQALPDNPSLDWLRKQAKRRLDELRKTTPSAKLAEAQFELAKQYGFASWRALKAHVDALTIDGQVLAATRDGDVATLTALLAEHPEKLELRSKPYDWPLLHEAAKHGRLAAVEFLLARGLDVNARESGDNTYAMHWAAAAGRLDIVRRLADAGGDVVGKGDDHQLEVIGWASCWEGTDDDAHRAVVDFLISRGARHHIFSAISLNLADEIRRMVAEDPAVLNSRLSRNENHGTPVHFAVWRNRPAMLALLLELGADPLAVDGMGQPSALLAMTSGPDRPVMERIREMLRGELVSAERGQRPPRVGMMDIVAVLTLGDYDTAARLVRQSPGLLTPDGPANGVLHLMAKRNETAAATWLLDHGADPNARWAHWEAKVAPLHLAALANHPDMVRLLLSRGADPRIRDSQHDSDAIGWAEFFKRPEIAQVLKDHVAKT
jgi:ankyrin repeat protein